MPAPRSAHPADAAPPRNPAPSQSYDHAKLRSDRGFPPPPPPPAPRPRIPGFGAPSGAAGTSRAAADPPAAGWRPPGARPAATPPIEPSVRQEPSCVRNRRSGTRSARPAQQEPSFDAIWPADRRADRIEPQQDLPPEPAPPPLAPRLNGDATSIGSRRAARNAAENAPVSVLKSGVVDGMAYTLYTDGSIEAELAQGVVRFGSIEELRNHLEKGA